MMGSNNRVSIYGAFPAKIKDKKATTNAVVTFTADFTYSIAYPDTLNRFANGIVPIEEMKKQLRSTIELLLAREYSAPTPLKKVTDTSIDIYSKLMNHSVSKWDILWGIKLTSANITSIKVD